MTETTVVRENLMTRERYTGYCGEAWNRNCSMPRTNWDSARGQFVCPKCGWVSQYPIDFIKRYREKWNK